MGNLNKVWMTCFLLHNITIRDNDNVGYNVPMATQRGVELARERERMAKGFRGGARVPLFNPEVDWDELDRRHAAGGGEGQGVPNIGVPDGDWEEVLRRLGHMQCHYQNFQLKNKAMNFLWTKYGKS